MLSWRSDGKALSAAVETPGFDFGSEIFGVRAHGLLTSAISVLKSPWTEDSGQATAHGAAKSQTRSSDQHFNFSQLY